MIKETANLKRRQEVIYVMEYPARSAPIYPVSPIGHANSKEKRRRETKETIEVP